MSLREWILRNHPRPNSNCPAVSGLAFLLLSHLLEQPPSAPPTPDVQ